MIQAVRATTRHRLLVDHAADPEVVAPLLPTSGWPPPGPCVRPDPRPQLVTSAAVGWRVGAATFIALLALTTVAGWVAVQLDPQYAASTWSERAVVGIFGGAFGAALLSPLLGLVSTGTGLVVGAAHRRQLRDRASGQSTGPALEGGIRDPRR